MKVPFLDLKAQYDGMADEIDTAIKAVIAKTAFAGGPFVEEFEKSFAEFCDCRHAVGVGSGTDALWLALLAMGVGEGDEVVTAVNTFIATAEAVNFCGARTIFVDVDESTYTMRPEAFRAAITTRTKAVIPVHLFGQTADMDPIREIAREHGLLVIEDACQAHGAAYKGDMAGSLGDAGCFSFYPGKNLGAYGEAGAVVTNDGNLATELRMLRDHGQKKKYVHSRVGWNARMDGLQGAILKVKLGRLLEANEARRRSATTYRDLLGDRDDVILPCEADYARHVYHVYAVRVRDRDRVMRDLMDKEIGCGIHYPIPLHLQEPYRSDDWCPGAFPVAERCAEEFLSLPMYPELSLEQIHFVAESLGGSLDGK